MDEDETSLAAAALMDELTPVTEAADEATATAEAAAAEAETAAETATQAAQSAAESAQLASSNSSERSELETQNRLLRENLDLVFRQLHGLAAELRQAMTPFQAVLEQVDATTELMQQVISRQDEQQEQLGVGIAALAQVTRELTGALSAHQARQTTTSR